MSTHQKILIIVESPAKCKKIEEYLGREMYKCIASFGHIRELATKNGLKCIQKDKNYEPIFQNVRKQGRSKDIVKTLQNEIAHSKEVLLATDDDREGEAIAWHICMVCKLPVKTTKRIIFHEITKTALQRAVRSPTTVNMKKVNSQKARQVLDLLVGFTISPMLKRSIQTKTALSAGRCQTPALRLVYDNQKQIDKAPGKECYDITGNFTDKNIPYKLNTTIDKQEIVEELLEETVNFEHMLTNEKPKIAKKTPPKPLTTSQLQQKASNVLGMSPKTTMATAQKLYEAGYITYMRTDSTMYSKEFIESAKKYILENYGEQYIHSDVDSLSLRKNDSSGEKEGEGEVTENTKKIKKTKKAKTKNDNNAQEAHEAIRPTDVKRVSITMDENNKIGKREISLYKLIWCNTLESCMSDAKLLKFLSTITAPMDFYYTKTFEKVTFKGWLIVQDKEDEKNYYSYIRKVNQENSVHYNKVSAEFTLRDLKNHYTEAKLVSLLEKKGIGRPSTFSSLISKIQERGYALIQDVPGRKIKCTDFELIDCEINESTREKVCGAEKKKMVIQPLGISVIEFLIKYYDSLFNYDYTSKMETELDKIEGGSKIWHTLCQECDETMMSICGEVKDTFQNEQLQLDEEHVYKNGPHGWYIQRTIPGQKKKQNMKVKQEYTREIIEEMLNADELVIEDIVERNPNEPIGQYKGEDVMIKKGKYGIYAQVGGKNVSLKGIDKEQSEITVEDVISCLEAKSSESGVVRILNEFYSLRKGKYGNYIFYKTPQMNRPKFINIKKYTGNMEIDEIPVIMSWIEENS
jgi:DNA topoisomerase-1